MNIVITRANSKDAADICAIDRERFTDPWAEKNFADIAVKSEVFLLKAVIDGVIAGFIAAFNEWELIYIARIAVSREAERKGIGTALLNALPSEKLVLDVRYGNTGARAFYESYGFEQAAVRKNFYERPREDGCTYILER